VCSYGSHARRRSIVRIDIQTKKKTRSKQRKGDAYDYGKKGEEIAAQEERARAEIIWSISFC
jgi:hypothetical protein